MEDNPRKGRKNKAQSSQKSKFRIQDKNVVHFRALRKFHIKAGWTTNHIEYLERCRQLVPKTFHIKIQAQILDTNSNFLIKWEAAYMNFVCTLVKLLHGYWKDKVSRIENEIQESNKNLRSQKKRGRYEPDL